MGIRIHFNLFYEKHLISILLLCIINLTTREVVLTFRRIIQSSRFLFYLGDDFGFDRIRSSEMHVVGNCHLKS